MVTISEDTIVAPDENLSLLRLLDPGVISDPYPLYRQLRELEPVHWDPYMHAWVVTGYPEVVTVLMNYSADRTPPPAYLDRLGLSFMKPFAEVMLQQMLFMDGAMHARLRAICGAAITPKRVEELRNVIQTIANELIDKVIANGNMDMVVDFANPLPATVTARMLGVPVEDRVQLQEWVIDIAEVLEERKRPTNGLIGSLMMAEVDGHKLSDDEVIANAIITLIGGHETTTNLIASGFLTLLRQPQAFEQFRTHPEIAAPAVEELLRYEAPVQHTARIAPAQMKLGGKTIEKGSRVVAGLAAANRDPARFPDPDRLDLLRTDNRHLAFGWAAHFCFGAPLARMEGQIAFNTLLRRISNPVLREEKLNWRENAGLRGLTSLNISFDPSTPIH